MATNATLWREYLRGREPGDWYHLYLSTGEVWPIRSVDGDPHRAGWLSVPSVAARDILAWAPADAEFNRADQETLSQFSLPAVGSIQVACLRASGATATETHYWVAVDATLQTLAIGRMVAGSKITMQTVAIEGLRPFCSWWCRAGVLGTTLRAKAWIDGEAEPADFQASVTTAHIADGSLGIVRQSNGVAAEYFFFSYGTDGETAPGPESIPAGMATWALDPDAQIELTCQIELYDPLAQEAARPIFSTRGRYTDARDFPPAEEMAPLVLDAGSLAVRLAEDLLYGATEESLGRVQLRNPRNVLAYLLDRTAAGRLLTIRAGLASWTSHRWFEPIYSGLVEGEPTIDDTVDISLQAPARRLEQLLQGRKYVGIPTCIELDGDGHAVPHSPSYDLTMLLLSFRFSFDSTPAVDTGITKSTAVTADNFSLYLEGGTGEIVARASSGGVDHAIDLRSAAGTNYADGEIHLAALGIDSGNNAYLIVDEAIVAEMTPGDLVDTPAADIEIFGFAGGRIFDIRLLSYCPSSQEAQSLLATRAMGDDPGMAGLWPCDDGAGAVATDHSPGLNDLAFAGTVDVNYTWTPTNSGEEEQAGVQMQFAAGLIFNAPALLIDRNRQRFRLSDGALPGVVTVRSKGDVIATWTDEGDGVIEFPTVTSEPVTFNHGATAGGDEAHLRFASVLEEILTERMGLDETGYDPIATRALDSLIPYNVAFFAEQEMAQSQAMSTLIEGLANYRHDRDGRILPGAVLPPVSPGPIPGEAVLEFLGTAGRSRVAWTTTTGDVPDGPFTIAFWVKSFYLDRWRILGDDGDPFPSYAAIANNISADLGGYYIGLYRAASGSIGFRFPWLSSVYYVMPSGSIPWGMWTFVVCRYDGTFLKLYAGKLGGELVQVFTTITSGSQIGTAQGLELGGRLTATDQGSLWGSIAHYQVHAEAVADLQALMDAGGVPDLEDPNLTFYAPLSDGAGRLARDLVSGTNGTIWGARWAPRMIFDFRVGLSRSKAKAKRLRPAWNGIVEFLTNWKPLSDADIAGPVSAVNRALLKRPSRRQPAPDSGIRGAYLDSREISTKTALMDLEAARRVARDLRYRFDPSRIQAAVADAPRAALALQPGDEIWIYYPRINGSQGAAVRVVGMTPSLKTLRTALDLWGDRLPTSEAAILVGEMSPMLTDAGDVIITD